MDTDDDIKEESPKNQEAVQSEDFHNLDYGINDVPPPGICCVYVIQVRYMELNPLDAGRTGWWSIFNLKPTSYFLKISRNSDALEFLEILKKCYMQYMQYMQYMDIVKTDTLMQIFRDIIMRYNIVYLRHRLFYL